MGSELLPLLMRETGLSELDISRIVHNGPSRYKNFPIKKRNGGVRLISQPARELKALQRVLIEGMLVRQPVHSAAKAYKKGVSIKLNAAAHVQNGPILKFDFKNFFPSITAADWSFYCRQRSLLNEEDIFISTQILFHKGGRTSGGILQLAIGAPSSPHLSNILMYRFDELMTNLVSKEQVIYTRYADDLTFSASRTGFLTIVKPRLQQAIQEIKSPSLTVNEDKTVLATKKYKRMVTGLILTNDRKVSIGRLRKRRIRAALHHYVHGRLLNPAQAQLVGYLAFINDVEPEFLLRLKSKYGEAVFERLKASVNFRQVAKRK